MTYPMVILTFSLTKHLNEVHMMTEVLILSLTVCTLLIPTGHMFGHGQLETIEKKNR